MESTQIETQKKSEETKSRRSFAAVTDPTARPASPHGDFIFGVKLFLIGGLVVLSLWLLNRFVS